MKKKKFIKIFYTAQHGKGSMKRILHFLRSLEALFVMFSAKKKNLLLLFFSLPRTVVHRSHLSALVVIMCTIYKTYVRLLAKFLSISFINFALSSLFAFRMSVVWICKKKHCTYGAEMQVLNFLKTSVLHAILQFLSEFVSTYANSYTRDVIYDNWLSDMHTNFSLVKITSKK